MHEDDYIQISALQHYVYCPRQCGLIHVENAWTDNMFTVRGEILHEKVDTDTYETRGTKKTVRGLRIHSARLGIVGRCDVVEFYAQARVEGRLLPSLSKSEDDLQRILPVEFKSGEPKEDVSDKVQLCAQVLCLEEMLTTTITQGAFFYGKIRRRNIVEIDESIRKQTEDIVTAVHGMVTSKKIPPAEYSQKCRNCSLEELCMPKAMNEKKLKMYMKELYEGTE
jgi:CRISPR-associated exonuclease Cas4